MMIKADMPNLTKMEAAANDWLLGQCEGRGVHYRQEGDTESTCGDRWARHTAARDFVTCKSCLAILRSALRKREGTSPPVQSKAA